MKQQNKIKSAFLAAFFVLLQVLTFENANCSIEYYRSSRDFPLIQAMEILEKSSAQDAVKFILEHDVKLILKDMRELGKMYRDHDALSWISDAGQHVIYINKKHSDAPPPALAAIISHEIFHSDRENSICEEIAAWQQEGKIWQEMLEQFPELKNIPNKTYPLLDRLNSILILKNRNKLSAEIINHASYRNLPRYSPGFSTEPN